MNRSFEIRAFFLMGVFAVGMILLVVRLVFLQIVDAPALKEMAMRQYQTIVEPLSLRGKILDRNGEILANSLPAYSLALHPNWVDEEERPRVCAFVRRIAPEWSCQKLFQERNFVWIRRRMGQEEKERYSTIVRSFAPALEWIEESQRVYPKGDLAGQLLGFVGTEGKGLEGLERSFDDALRPRSQRIKAYRDARRILLLSPEELARMDAQPPQITLTLDAYLQDEVEHLLKEACTTSGAREAQALVVELPSGSIRVAALSHSFDPNRFRNYKPEEWRFRIATDTFEPGSAVKPFILWAALRNGIPPWELIYAEKGQWEIMGHTLHDDEPHGWLRLEQMVVRSSNITAAKVGIRLGREKVYHTLRRFGFGEKPGLSLPLETAGILRPPQRWSQLELATIAFGQGFSVSLLQLAQAYARLVLGGIPFRLKLVEEDREPEREKNPPDPQDLAASRQVLSALKKAVDEGTGKKAMIPGLSIGGKTGTAQKADPRGGYSQDRYVALFVGIFPIESPRFLIAVLLDEPRTQIYGGQIAAPLFREIALRLAMREGLLKVKSDPVSETFRSSKSKPPLNRPYQETPLSDFPPDKEIIPDFTGLPLRVAGRLASSLGLKVIIRGKGFVQTQSPAPGTPLRQVRTIYLKLAEEG